MKVFLIGGCIAACQAPKSITNSITTAAGAKLIIDPALNALPESSTSGLLHFWDSHHAPQIVHFATSRSGAFCVRLISKMAQTSVY